VGVLGDVGYPQLVQTIAPKDAADEVQGRDLGCSGAAGQPTGRQSLDRELTHDVPDGVVADVDVPAVSELSRDAQGTVGAARGLVNGGDLPGQPDPSQRFSARPDGPSTRNSLTGTRPGRC